MVKKLAQKKNQSSTQVLKTLLTLIQGEFSMNELIEKLNENEEEPIFNNSVISKYINTCRSCEFSIPKMQNRYYVAKIPFGLDLSVLDIDLIENIQNFVKIEMSPKSQGKINSLVKKILHFSNKEIELVNKDDLLQSIVLFERAVANNRKIKLIFKNKANVECIPLGITRKNDKVFFNVYKKKTRNIDASRLCGIELLGQRYVEPYEGGQVVTFKLKGGLAKRYEARENEAIEYNPDGSITVINKNENKELLFTRLLRYDDKCEIIQPKAYREEMKNLISDMLNNYGAD